MTWMTLLNTSLEFYGQQQGNEARRFRKSGMEDWQKVLLLYTAKRVPLLEPRPSRAEHANRWMLFYFMPANIFVLFFFSKPTNQPKSISSVKSGALILQSRRSTLRFALPGPHKIPPRRHIEEGPIFELSNKGNVRLLYKVGQLSWTELVLPCPL